MLIKHNLRLALITSNMDAILNVLKALKHAVNQIYSGLHSSFLYPGSIVNKNNKYSACTRIPDFTQFPSKSLFLHYEWKVKTSRGSTFLWLSTGQTGLSWEWCIYWKIHWRKQGTVRNSISLWKWANKYLCLPNIFFPHAWYILNWSRILRC